MIVPAGYKSVKWVPSETKTKLTKTAGIGDEVIDVVEEVADVSGKDALYNAAKEVVDAMDAEGMDSDVAEVENTEVSDVSDVSDDSVVLDIEEEEVVPEEGALDEAVEEVVEDVAVDKVEEVVEKIVEDVAELQDVVQGADAVTEIGEEEVVEVDVEVDVPEDNEEEGLVVESDPDLGCALAKDEAGEKKDGDKEDTVEAEEEVDEKKEGEEDVSMDKSASVDGEFVKFAKLTPSNRKKIISYWKNDLNYPADYVALMAKDYEK